MAGLNTRTGQRNTTNYIPKLKPTSSNERITTISYKAPSADYDTRYSSQLNRSNTAPGQSSYWDSFDALAQQNAMFGNNLAQQSIDDIRQIGTFNLQNQMEAEAQRGYLANQQEQTRAGGQVGAAVGSAQAAARGQENVAGITSSSAERIKQMELAGQLSPQEALFAAQRAAGYQASVDRGTQLRDQASTEYLERLRLQAAKEQSKLQANNALHTANVAARASTDAARAQADAQKFAAQQGANAQLYSAMLSTGPTNFKYW